MLLVLLAVLASGALAQHPKKPVKRKAAVPSKMRAMPSIVGNWVIDPRVKDRNFQDPKAWFTFRKNGTFAYQTREVVGSGTYTMTRYHGTFLIKNRNGFRPRMLSEATADLELDPNGKSLAIEGRGGFAVALRLVRKPK